MDWRRVRAPRWFLTGPAWPWWAAAFLLAVVARLGYGGPWTWLLTALVALWPLGRGRVRDWGRRGRYRTLVVGPEEVRWEWHQSRPPGLPWTYERQRTLTLGGGKEPASISLPVVRRERCWVVDTTGRPLAVQAGGKEWKHTPVALMFLTDRSHVREFLRPGMTAAEKLRLGLLVALAGIMVFVIYVIYSGLRS